MSYQTYAIDPTGKKVNVTIKDGATYTQDGKRVGEGYTVQTNGGVYKMVGGKGVLVDSHNTVPTVVPTTPAVDPKANIVQSLSTTPTYTPTTSPTTPTTPKSYDTYAVDPQGNQINVTIKDGITYLPNGQRVGEGYTVQTNGGIWKMVDGKGVQVDSHNTKPATGVTTTPTTTPVTIPSSYVPMGTSTQIPRTESANESEISKLIKTLPSEILDYDSAKQRADETMGADYDKALETALKNIDRNALKTGFFGQLPTVDYKERNADDIERSRSQAISQLAQQLMSDSKADVRSKIAQLLDLDSHQFNKDTVNWEQLFKEREYKDTRGDVDWEKAFKEREYSDTRNDIEWEKLFKERGYTDERGDVDWEKAFKETELNWNKEVETAKFTGIFRDKPTLAYTELSHQIGLDNKKMEMAEKELNHSIQVNWEKLKNDKVGLSQAWARIGQTNDAKNLDETKFMAGIKEKAWDMAMSEMEAKGFNVIQNEFGWLPNVDGLPETSKQDFEKELRILMAQYTDVLLGNDNIYKNEGDLE